MAANANSDWYELANDFAVTNANDPNYAMYKINRLKQERPSASETKCSKKSKIPSLRSRSNDTAKHEIKHRANAQRPMRKTHERTVHPSIEVGHKHQKNLRLIK